MNQEKVFQKIQRRLTNLEIPKNDIEQEKKEENDSIQKEEQTQK